MTRLRLTALLTCLMLPLLSPPGVWCAELLAAEPKTATRPTVPFPHVEVMGRGPTQMILIPGLYVDWSMYEDFMIRNQDEFTMYAVTLPGFGGSGPPPESSEDMFSDQLWLQNAERALLDMMRERDIEFPVLVGHSLGAHVAVRVAAKHKDRIGAVVVLDTLNAVPMPGYEPGTSPTQDERKVLVDTRWATAMRNVGELTWQTQTNGNFRMQMKNITRAEHFGEMAGSVPRDVAQRYFLEMASRDLSDDFRTIGVRTLVIGALPLDNTASGDPRSLRLNWMTFQNIARENEDVTLIYFEDCNHFITEDEPRLLDETIEAFLLGQPVKGKHADPEP